MSTDPRAEDRPALPPPAVEQRLDLVSKSLRAALEELSAVRDELRGFLYGDEQGEGHDNGYEGE